MEWYAATDQASRDRLEDAWSDAASIEPELCGMLLEVARGDVLAYAPTTEPPVFNPASASWTNGTAVNFTRDGDLVTATLSIPGDVVALPTATLPVPAGFLPAGNGTVATTYMDGTVPKYRLSIANVSTLAPIGIKLQQMEAGPFVGSVLRYVADPTDATGTPARYVFAQLQQAKNLYNAGRIVGNQIGAEGFSFVPRPLSKEIQKIIRPQSGVARVF